MALTKEDKKRIEEEEAYRAKLREGTINKKRNYLAVFLIAIILFFFIRNIFSKKIPLSPTQNTSSITITQTQSDGNGLKQSPTNANYNQLEDTYKLGEAFNIKSTESDYYKFNWDITKTSLIKLDNYNVTSSLTPRNLIPKNGKFYIVVFEGINKGNEKSYISVSFAHDMILVDENGKKYSRNNSEAESAYLVYSHEFPTTDVANPDESTSVPILFDVPEQKYKLCDEKITFCILGIE